MIGRMCLISMLGACLWVFMQAALLVSALAGHKGDQIGLILVYD